MQPPDNLFQSEGLSVDNAGKLAWNRFCTPQTSRQPLSARQQKLAEKAERFHLKTGSADITYYRWQPISDEPSNQESKRVLLIHGWNGNAFSFVALTKALLRKGFEVVAFDAPAHGESSGERTDLIKFAESAQAVAKEIGSVYALTGHSLGAMTIAYMMGSNFPIAQDEGLQRLIMISPPESLAELIDNFMHAMGIPASVLEGIEREVNERFNRSIQWFSTSDFVCKTSIPLLLMHDSEDPETPLVGVEKIANAAPKAKLIVTENLGHYLIIRSPKVVKEILAFVSNT